MIHHLLTSHMAVMFRLGQTWQHHDNIKVKAKKSHWLHSSIMHEAGQSIFRTGQGHACSDDWKTHKDIMCVVMQQNRERMHLGTFFITSTVQQTQVHVQRYKNCSICRSTFSDHRCLATEEHATAQQSRQHTQPSYMPPHKQRTREARLTFYKGRGEKETVKRKEEWHKYTCLTGQTN